MQKRKREELLKM